MPPRAGRDTFVSCRRADALPWLRTAMLLAPVPVEPPALRRFCGAESPALGTLMRSIVGVLGAPLWIGMNVPEPLSERPGRPFAADAAVCPGITCAIWPDRKSATST